MIKVMIVDDENLARRRLERMLGQIDDVSLVGEAKNGEEALQMASSLQPDLVLMDIRMPGMDGLTAARKLAAQELSPAVVFCTAYDDFALDAFDAEASAYLVKPVKQEDLQRAIQQACKPRRTHNHENGANRNNERKHLHSKSHRGVNLIPVDQIRLLQADHKYVTAYFAGGEAVLDDTLKQLEEEFSNRFVRVHRNALVAKDSIQGLVQTEGHTQVKIRDLSVRPIVSRRLEPKVRKLISRL